MGRPPRTTSADRHRLLQIPWTPLLFFVLVLSIIESAFVLIITRAAAKDILMLFSLDVVAVIAIAVIVGLLAYLGVFNRRSTAYKLFLDPSEKVPLELSRIQWDDHNCFIMIGKEEIPVTPVYPQNAPGGSLELVIPGIDRIDEDTVIRLRLKDTFGNSWDVLPFRLWQTRRPLRITSDMHRILQSYPDEDDQ